ncbi:MAG: glycosyltransferase [Holophagales bacterium]|jgi:ceramide glucosyltransferase|nr:glycosyltransferase [Holophagales bacterium]
MTPAALLLAAFAALGLAITTLPVALLWRLKRSHRPFRRGPRVRAGHPSFPRAVSTEGRPRLSILKPLRGLDDGLEENLASFAGLRGVDYEVVLSVADPKDPALDAVARVRARFPEAPFVLVVGGAPAGRIGNPKVERLVAAARVARGDLFLVSDSNVRVSPDDVAETVALFDDPSVGCVSNVFVGSGARDFGAVVESLHLLTFVVPGNVLAAWSGTPCVVGKSMALPRHVHDLIGGFAAFGELLAEDQAIGLAVAEAGFRVVLSPVVISNVIERRTVARALDRQVRWGKIRYAFSKSLFAGELLMNPFPVALLAAFLAVPGGSPWAGSVSSLAFVALLLRVLQASLLGRICCSPLRPVELLAMPLKDLLQIATQAVPFFSKEVVWQGHRARIGKGTVLVEVERPRLLEAAGAVGP